ncbi:MAG: bacterioferritin [Oleiphilus sp.]|nr:MAG: bacterioferritin [Oleiphilus sp.]
MLVCICKGISDRDIESAMQQGASSFGELRKSLGVATCCGQCASYAKDLVNEKISENQAINAFHLAQEIRV